MERRRQKKGISGEVESLRVLFCFFLSSWSSDLELSLTRVYIVRKRWRAKRITLEKYE